MFDGPDSLSMLLSVQLKSDPSNAADCEAKAVVLELVPADVLEEDIWWSCLKSLRSNMELHVGFSRFKLRSLELSVSLIISLLGGIIFTGQLESMLALGIPYKSAVDMDGDSILLISSILLKMQALVVVRSLLTGFSRYDDILEEFEESVPVEKLLGGFVFPKCAVGWAAEDQLAGGWETIGGTAEECDGAPEMDAGEE